MELVQRKPELRKIANMSANSGFAGENPSVPATFLQPLANALIDSNLPLARELMETIPMGQRGEFLQTLRAITVSSMSAISAKTLPGPVSAETSLSRSDSLLLLTREFAPMSMEQVLPAILNGAAGGFGDRSEIDAFLERAQLTENEKIIAARYFARGSQDRNRITVSSSETDDKRYTDQIDLTKELAPTLSDQLLAEAQAEKRTMNAKLAKAHIEKLQSWKNITDQQLIQTLTRYDFSSQIDAAIKQAERISDAEKRKQVIEELWKNP
jgi:hypothetical protein